MQHISPNPCCLSTSPIRCDPFDRRAKTRLNCEAHGNKVSCGDPFEHRATEVVTDLLHVKLFAKRPRCRILVVPRSSTPETELVRMSRLSTIPTTSVSEMASTLVRNVCVAYPSRLIVWMTHECATVYYGSANFSRNFAQHSSHRKSILPDSTSRNSLTCQSPPSNFFFASTNPSALALTPQFSSSIPTYSSGSCPAGVGIGPTLALSDRVGYRDTKPYPFL